MKLLVVIDTQNDFIDGSLGTAEAKAIVPNIVEKIKCLDPCTLLLFTKDTHYPNYLTTYEGKMLPIEHCIEGTTGWSINKYISEADKMFTYMHYNSGDIINSRIYKNTFGSDVLEEFLKEHSDVIESIEFVGLCTDICVISNVLMARQKLPNIPIIVDASCCAGTTPNNHISALNVMKSCQIVITNEGVL